MTRQELFAAIVRDIDQRTRWENRQGQLYKGRYRGLRRTNPPWPGCSDVNWPLVDGIIDKLKPIYFGQLFASDLLATFFPTAEASGIAAQLATAAAQWFDFRLKQESNLEQEILYAIDYMLMLGRPVVKTLWDAERNEITFRAIAPGNIIVPASTRSLVDADRIVHVLVFTPEGYRREAGFRQGDEFLKRITGRGIERTHQGEGAVVREHLRRAGITEGQDDQIIVWEVWQQQRRGQWIYECFSPLAPEDDVKPRTEHPYEHGEPPFVDFPYEVTQPDWLAPRGACEILLPYQAELTKLLNEKNDALTFFNRPLFQTDRDVPNAVNLRFHPGQILPFGVKPVAMPTPPIDWERQMLLMRDIAERQIAVPDYGMSQVQDIRRARTATEIEQLTSVSQQSADLRMRIFRMSLGRLFQQAFALLRQYANRRLAVWIDDALVNIPAEALKGQYRIRPSGSADGVTRQQMWRKAVARLQLFANDPFINQAELRKSVLEADDSGLVKRLFQDPQVSQATQAEDQILEIGIMKLGHPALVTSADDHATHLRAILHYVQTQARAGAQPGPVEAQLLADHIEAHLQGLQQRDPKQARMAWDAFAVVGAALPQQSPNGPAANGSLSARGAAPPDIAAAGPPISRNDALAA